MSHRAKSVREITDEALIVKLVMRCNFIQGWIRRVRSTFFNLKEINFLYYSDFLDESHRNLSSGLNLSYTLMVVS